MDFRGNAFSTAKNSGAYTSNEEGWRRALDEATTDRHLDLLEHEIQISESQKRWSEDLDAQQAAKRDLRMSDEEYAGVQNEINEQQRAIEAERTPERLAERQLEALGRIEELLTKLVGR